MNRPDFEHFLDCRDASPDPEAFSEALIAALSIFTSAETWELAIEAAQILDEREAMKRAASS